MNILHGKANKSLGGWVGVVAKHHQRPNHNDHRPMKLLFGTVSRSGSNDVAQIMFVLAGSATY